MKLNIKLKDSKYCCVGFEEGEKCPCYYDTIDCEMGYKLGEELEYPIRLRPQKCIEDNGE